MSLNPHPRYPGAMAVIMTIALLLGTANLILGDLNQDEGWYLYAATKVSEGRLPYRDYAFTQGPMLPLVYSLATPVITSHGVAGGRAITWLIGFGAALFAAGAARRLGGRAAGIIAFALIMLNVYQGYFTTVVKTYALCSFFLAAGVYFLSRWIGRRQPGWLVATGVVFALAAGTRISTGIVLAVVGLWLLVQPGRWGRLSWLWFGIGGGLTLVAMFVPLYIVAKEGFLFGLLEFHTLREAGSLMSSLVFKGGFVSRLVQSYFVAVILLVLMAGAKWWRPFRGTDSGYHQSDAFQLVRLLWICVAVLTLVHVSAPFPYDDYQVPVYPVLAVALAVSWAYALRAWSGLGYRWSSDKEPADPPFTRWFVWSLVLLCTAASFSSPLNQDWMIAGRDRIWWKIKPSPSLLQLREIAREIREADRSGVLLTQDTYLAVEAGLDVPEGWEMGPFCYYPGITDERATSLHLVNRARLLAEIAGSKATFAAISGYGLSIASPEVQPVDDAEYAGTIAALEQRYELVREVPTFGQAATTLRLYRLRIGVEAP